MLESIALAGSRVESEQEYVFVKDDDFEFDDDSYDHCDVSTDLSCATSVASEVTLKDFSMSQIQEGIESSVVSLDEAGAVKVPGDPAEIKTEKRQMPDMSDLSTTKETCRLSNKKRRKQIKTMKKAAAAAAAAAVALTQVNHHPHPSPPRPIAQERQRSRRSKTASSMTISKSRSRNIAVACAQESLEAYREEIRMERQKKTMTMVGFVSVL